MALIKVVNRDQPNICYGYFNFPDNQNIFPGYQLGFDFSYNNTFREQFLDLAVPSTTILNASCVIIDGWWNFVFIANPASELIEELLRRELSSMADADKSDIMMKVHSMSKEELDNHIFQCLKMSNQKITLEMKNG